MVAEQKTRKTKGSISGDAQMILDALDDLRLPESFKPFIKKIRQSTYYKAGFHVDDAIEGIEEHSCYFSLAAWAKEIGMSRQQLYNLRTDLIEHHVITYASIPEDPHHGIIAWNLSVSEWVKFSKGGKREGAGRPKKNQSVYTNEGQKNIQSVYEDNSIGVQKIFNQCTPTPDEGRQTQAATPPLRNLKKQQKRNDLPDANASVGVTANAHTPQTPLPLSGKKFQEPKDEPLSEDDPAYKVALYLHGTIAKYAPDARLPAATPKGLAVWVKDTRTMLDTHKRAPPDIKLVIDFVADEPFWQAHILSARKLKEKFDTLLVQAKRGKTNGQRQQGYPVSSRAQASRHRQMATSSQRESRPGDDE